MTCYATKESNKLHPYIGFKSVSVALFICLKKTYYHKLLFLLRISALSSYPAVASCQCGSEETM